MLQSKPIKRHQSIETEEDFIQQPVRTVLGEVFVKKYRKIGVVGSGSYSKCYLVKTSDSDSTYVAKVIPKKKLQILQKEKLFYEIKIHKSLSHPNVVHLDHWFEDQTSQYIFMEYCSRGNLENLLKRVGKMDQKIIKKYARQIVEGVGYIHSQKILHRDLKLCNFYLDEDDDVKLGDFGFACQLANDSERKRQTCGTPNYIAPEVISGFGYSFYSDVWAIGVILFRLKFHACPFEAEHVKQTLQNVKLCRYKWPKSPKVSPQFKDLVEKIFTLNYDDRLTTDQILEHPFFASSDELLTKKSSQKFSFANIFSKSAKTDRLSDKKQEKQKMTRKSIYQRTENSRQEGNRKNIKNEEEETHQRVKKHNSCETMKQIKQIFKSKSKGTMHTSTNHTSSFNNQGSQMRTYQTINSLPNSNNSTSRESKRINSTMGDGLTNLSETFYNCGFGENNIGEKGERVKKLNDFIKKQANTLTFKEEMKKKKSTNLNNPQYGNNPPLNVSLNINTKDKAMIGNAPKNQVLLNSAARYYLPQQVQQQKNMFVIHYRSSIKQIIFGDTSLIVHRNCRNLYDMLGNSVSLESLGKVHRYILETKVKIEEHEKSENQTGDILVDRILLMIPHSWVVLKEGIILKYGGIQSLVVSKLFIQEPFHIWDTLRSGTNALTMYSVQPDGKEEVFEGIVVMRIYTGWVKSMLKK